METDQMQGLSIYRARNIVNVVMDYDPGGLGYTLAKAAGTPLTRGPARKLAPIRVNAVSPGALILGV